MKSLFCLLSAGMSGSKPPLHVLLRMSSCWSRIAPGNDGPENVIGIRGVDILVYRNDDAAQILRRGIRLPHKALAWRDPGGPV